MSAKTNHCTKGFWSSYFKYLQVFLREELSATPYSLSVCPLSTCLAIGYESAVKVFNIVLDVLVETKRFDVTAPSQVSFAPGGHLLAYTDGNIIHLCYNIGFKELTTLHTHVGKVHILLWRNNNHLLSSDEEGTIYEWNIPRKQSLWSLSVPDVIHTCITSPLKGEDLYAAGGDSTIRRIKVGAVLNSYSLNVTGISAMSAIEHWLLVGTEDGKILGVNLSLSATNFQLQCQTGRIIHFAVLPDIKSIMAVDEHGIASTWSFQNEKRRESLPSRAEVLIDLDKQKEYIQCVENLEEELMRCTQRTDASREQQRKKLEEVQVEASEKYRRIEDSLRVTAEKLKEELEEIRRSLEENYLNMKRSIESEIEDNKKDFHKKMSEEAMNLQREKEERARIEQEFEDTVSQRIKEKKMVLEDFQTKYSRHMEQLQVLKDLLDKEKAITSEVKKECENFNRSNEKEEQDVPQTLVVGNETYSDMKFKKEKERHISEMEELDSQFVYHKECCKSIEDAFKTKHRLFRRLHDLAEELKGRVNQVQADISRIEDVLTTKSEFTNHLEGAATELSTEGNQKIEECEEEIRRKGAKLQEIKNQLQKCKESHKKLCDLLKIKRREETVLNERLKATENSVMDNTRQLVAAELLLERYRMEFVNYTSECPNAMALRWAMLRLYEKRVAKTAVKEESLFFTETDPYVRFCKQRDHYENLINVVRSRTSQIKATFRENFIKLAKENSDWSSFAEALRADIRLKQSRIRCLEEGLGLKVEEFGKNPAETQRRLLETAEKLSSLKEEEDKQIEQRLTLIQEQQEEIFRLHGLLSVEDKGKIIRKMR
ncbi:cilia- and flagella-associated protein 57-like [Argiope bruennichi]|uniref:cilia- and flagella-associated protein 57-like n=1 Tax=Argiope bruennichi TaxID=94029 RepID=UPI0024953218|nr:cilia- and flagella-associated protein 57-like [Argiope bruennichi]